MNVCKINYYVTNVIVYKMFYPNYPMFSNVTNVINILKRTRCTQMKNY